jgi:hypothetical protein
VNGHLSRSRMTDKCEWMRLGSMRR